MTPNLMYDPEVYIFRECRRVGDPPIFTGQRFPFQRFAARTLHLDSESLDSRVHRIAGKRRIA